jgi:intracellular septation protein
MKILLDFLPLVLFFGTYKLYGIYAATAVIMAATVVQMAITYKLEGKLQLMHKAMLVLVLAFGALTLALQDDRFIKWKPTVFYTAIALGLALALWVWRKNVLKLMLGNQLELPDPLWYRLNLAWIAYSLFMAALNAYVVLYYSTDAWANFKLWGYVFPLAFIIGQGIYIAPHLKGDEPGEGPKP